MKNSKLTRHRGILGWWFEGTQLLLLSHALKVIILQVLALTHHQARDWRVLMRWRFRPMLWSTILRLLASSSWLFQEHFPAYPWNRRDSNPCGDFQRLMFPVIWILQSSKTGWTHTFSYLKGRTQVFQGLRFSVALHIYLHGLSYFQKANYWSLWSRGGSMKCHVLVQVLIS